MNREQLFTYNLLVWHREENKREMPWKGEIDAYKVWLSEIILQQTKVEQGLAYYQRFVKSFPNVEALAEAEEDEVMRLWQGLGYYSRARNLHHTAKEVKANYGGKFPISSKELIKLKGIGEYTAAAISSFVHKERIAVVDGNVIRVLARYFRIQLPFDSSEGKKVFREKANSLIDRLHPNLYNQAIMDFGATVCKPKNPNCENCPLAQSCIAYKKQLIGELPVKGKKIEIKKRFFLALFIETKKGTVIEKRTEDDIWKGLYQLPNFELESFPKDLKNKASEILKDEYFLSEFKIVEQGEIQKQKLSHREIQMVFVHIITQDELILSDKYIYTRNLAKFAFPKVFILYFQSKGIN